MICDGRLEPGPGPTRLVEHRGVGNLELGDRVGPLEPGTTVVGRKRIGDDSHHARQEAAQVTGTESGADPVRRRRVLHRTQPVVEGLEADARLGQLTLGPLVAVGTTPQWVGRVGAQFDEGGSPFGSKK